MLYHLNRSGIIVDGRTDSIFAASNIIEQDDGFMLVLEVINQLGVDLTRQNRAVYLFLYNFTVWQARICRRRYDDTQS